MHDTTGELVARLRHEGADPREVAIWPAVHDLPRELVETLSAFANTAGGTILLGLGDDLSPVPGFNQLATSEMLVRTCTERLEPAVRGDVTIELVDQAPVVRLDVHELDPLHKPCFIKARGMETGAYLRVADGNRQLTGYELGQLRANRVPHDFDRETVPRATLADLDTELVSALFHHAKRRSPRLFAGADATTALMRLGVLSDHSGQPVPTLAGLLALGRFPQQFYPQLCITVSGTPTDHEPIDGPIPELIDEALKAVSSSGVIAPIDALRELVANALIHRDYSPGARGTPVHIEVSGDRIVVVSPGGLYGSVFPGALGTPDQQSSCRNRTLAKLLSDVVLPSRQAGVETAVCANHGTGLRLANEAVRRAALCPFTYESTPGEVRATLRLQALMSPSTLSWLDSLRQPNFNNDHTLALAIAHHLGSVNLPLVLAWGGNATMAPLALRALVTAGFLVRDGGRHWTTYRLPKQNVAPPPLRPAHVDEADPFEPFFPAQVEDIVEGVVVPDLSEVDLDEMLHSIRTENLHPRNVRGQVGTDESATQRRIRMLRGWSD